MSEFKFEHGKEAKDQITGFKGVVTGRADYITGCNQYLLVPTVDNDGKKVDAHWLDENRLELVPDGREVNLDVSDTKDPGACEPAPNKG